jgi:hypothetical protein
MSARRSTPEPGDQPQRGSAAAPLFWACLLIAAALYAPCVLADRIVGWSDLRQEYERRQAELVAAQQQVRHLQRVAAALEADAEFSAQVARAELGAAPAGTQRIVLPPELNNDPRIPPASAVAEPPREPWYVPSLRLVAGDASLRRNLLIAAAAVFLFGFLVFRDGAFTAPRGVLRTVFGRYLREEECEK